MRGLLVSADFAHPDETVSRTAVSYMLAGMIQHQDNARLFNEVVIEEMRRRAFQSQISRLRGMYFFRGRQEALEVLEQRWADHFVEDNLLELDLRCRQLPSCVDANWITYAKTDNTGRIRLRDCGWIGAYWSGETFGPKPVWEFVASGVAIVLDTEVRRRCYDLLLRLFPESHVAIEMAHIAGEVGSRGGQTTPYLIGKSANAIELCYLANDDDFHDKEIIERIVKHPSGGHLGRLMAAAPQWRSPDFRPWFRTFSLSEVSIIQGAVTLSKLHLSQSSG